MTDCFAEGIDLCLDTIIASRTVKCFPNRITADLKELWNKKKRVFRNGDREEQRGLQKELKGKLKDSRDAYRMKL